MLYGELILKIILMNEKEKANLPIFRVSHDNLPAFCIVIFNPHFQNIFRALKQLVKKKYQTT